jgi:hypothetical protein
MTVLNVLGNTLSGQNGTGLFCGSVSPTITTPTIAQINTGGNPAITFTGGVSYLHISGAFGSGNPITIQAVDPLSNDVPIEIATGGSGQITLGTIAATNQFILGTGTSKTTTISVANGTGSPQTLTIPDLSGTWTLKDNSTTGTGDIVLSTSPSLVTPALDVPTSGTLTNCVNLPLTSGVIGNLPVTNLNSGTNASSASFWRGDGTWTNLGNGYYSVTQTLTASQLQNLSSTPIQLIPGLSGYVIVPVYAWSYFVYTGTVFSADLSANLYYGSGVTKISASAFVVPLTKTSSANDLISEGRINSIGAMFSTSDTSGQPVYIKSLAGASGGGTSTYTISITYYLIQL